MEDSIVSKYTTNRNNLIDKENELNTKTTEIIPTSNNISTSVDDESTSTTKRLRTFSETMKMLDNDDVLWGKWCLLYLLQQLHLFPKGWGKCETICHMTTAMTFLNMLEMSHDDDISYGGIMLADLNVK